MKKVISLVLSIVLAVTLIPFYGPSTHVSANTGNFFSFNNESSQKSSARIVSTDTVTLTGTLNNVIGSSISYKVTQVPSTGGDGNPETNASTQDITLGISVVGNNITVQNMVLFPGMNKIEFKGSNGAGEVSGIIYIEYRDSPMITNLQFIYNHAPTPHSPEENAITMLYKPLTANTADLLSISGNAPNASNVELILNGDSYSYQVTNNSGYTFRFGSLPLKPGINDVTFKITSGTHEFTTTRQVVLYANSPVFFNDVLNFKEGTTSDKKKYVPNSEMVVKAGVSSIDYEGTLIVPKPFVVDSTTSITDPTQLQTYLSDANNNFSLGYTVSGVTGSVYKKTAASNITVDDSNSGYFKVDVVVPFATTATEVDAVRGKTVTFRLSARMNEVTHFSNYYSVRLIDGSASYIADVNYMSGYQSSLVTQGAAGIVTTSSPNTFLSMQSTDIPSITHPTNNAVDVYGIPFMVELLIGQYQPESVADLVANIELRSGGIELEKRILTDGTDIVTQPVTVTVNGVPMTYTRIFLEISKLRVTGKNKIDFKFKADIGTNKYNKEAVSYNFNLMTGPYVRLDGVSNGMNIKYHSRRNTTVDILKEVNGFKGSLFNLADTSQIKYGYDINNNKTAAGEQTVFLYLNNVELPLRPTDATMQSFDLVGLIRNTAANSNNEITGFDDSKVNLNSILGALNKGGTNTLKFVFYSSSYNFTTNYTFTIEPKDLPKIPAENGGTIYPYENSLQWPPVYNSNDFALTGTTYTTSKANANIIGTFDLVDVSTSSGSSSSVDINSITREVDALTKDGAGKNFKVVISSPEWKEAYEWNLGNEFYLANDELKLYESGGTLTDDFSRAFVVNEGEIPTKRPETGLVRMIYNAESNYFYFNITNQEMPEDNSPLVFVVTVYNAGDGGPRASYRVEINPISIPYTIHSPLPENRLTNSNYVEVIISSPGAEAVTINKQKAEVIKYRHYKMDQTNGTEVDAFKVVVKNLKANKETSIPFSITRAGVTTTGTIPIKYVPTNIPGAEYLETMKNSHKLFDGALTLTFPRNTNLIRSNYAANNDYATQVYNSHDLLFSIANNVDGIVNRHLFESIGANYTVESIRDGRNIMTDQFLDYAGRYIKASQVFWIDAGLADDPNTNNYDPVVRGLDPFPFPNQTGLKELGVAYRKLESDREIIPSKPGTLTLQYDSSIVSNASTTVTVFHYDPVLQRWDNIGGVVDTKKGTIQVPFNKFGYYVVAKLTRSYNDVTFHSYARDAMETIYAKGIMNAVNNAVQFGGDQYVTRGEFARMIVKALDLPLNYSGTLHFNYYPDTMSNANVSQALYDYRHIETAARAGIVNGTAPGFFDETAQLQRKDAAVILARALELKLETNSTKAKNEAAKAFQDALEIDYYAIPSVLAIQKKGFIKGVAIDQSNPKAGYVFQPNARLLRADAAIIIARVLTDQKKLPQLYL